MKNLIKWLQGANASIYSCHLLACWSGRMWAFSLGLFLITVSPKSLQLSATYGLCMGVAILIFGAIIGDWVDKTPRLKAATMSMIFQNLLIATCACVVFTLIMLLSEMKGIADWLGHLFYAIIISLSVCSRLMKEARIIVVERDWIVEMCAKDEHQLTVMTASFQRLDLFTKILAPIVTGQILTYAGLKIGCGFIAVWILFSLGFEYYLIRRVYNIVPALKSIKCKMGYAVKSEHMVQVYHDDGVFDGIVGKSPETTEHIEAEQMERVKKTGGESSRAGCYVLWQILNSFVILHRGLKTYFRSVTMWPGLALACLYLTVLTMGHITVGYGTMQGLSGSILGIMTGVGAGFGILATMTYPPIVRKLGLPITGVLALGLQVMCLTLCVISVWLPGSPFDLYLSYTRDVQESHEKSRNCSFASQNKTHESVVGELTSDLMANVTSCVDGVSHSGTDSNLSVWVMIAGIVLARFGLWTAHMAIVQLFLENVAVDERGIINGFQTSLNQLMNFIKYALVVILPHSHQFGLLVLISYVCICTGWMFLGVNAVKASRRKRMEVHRKKSEIMRRDSGEIKIV